MIDRDKTKARLQAELKDLLRRHSRLSAHLRNTDRDLPADWSEMAQFVQNDEVLEALEERTRHRVDGLVLAIARIEQGIYETCTSCGGAIESERLEVLPISTICASCA